MSLAKLSYNKYYIMTNHHRVSIVLIFTFFTLIQETRPIQRLLTQNLDPDLVLVNSTRSKSIQLFCPKNSRNLISSDDISTNSQYFSMLSTYFKQDAILMIKNILNSDWPALENQARDYISIYIFILPFIIGLILILILWSCLCCCCICPNSCPSKCCQKQQELLYQKCELACPAIFLILLLLVATIASIPGITKASGFTNSIKTAQCGLSIFFDDALNGGISSDGTTFFAGLSTLNFQFIKISSNVLNIVNNFTGSVLTNVKNMVTDTSNANAHIQNIANPNIVNTTLSLTYNQATPQSNQTIISSYVNILGTPNNSSSLTGILYNIIGIFSNAMKSVSSSIDSFSNQTEVIQYKIDDAKNNLQYAYMNIFNIDGNIRDAFDKMSPIVNYSQLGIIIYFAVVIVFSLIAILATILVSCFDKLRCRHLMYFACFFLYLACIIGFIISLVLSVMIPVMYKTCTTANYGLSDRNNYLNFINKINFNSDYQDQIGICLKGGNGQFLSSNLGININTQIYGIQNAINTAQIYSSYDKDPLLTNLNSLKNNNSLFLNNANNDIIYDSGTLNYFKSIANQSYYNCLNINSIVPSTNSPSINIIPCAQNTVPTNCSSFTTCTQINPCINLDSIFSDYLSSSSKNTSTYIKGDINARYIGCSNIADDLYNLYQNWYIPKYNTLTGVQDRTNTVSNDIDKIVSDLTFLTGNFSSAYKNMTNEFKNLIDPEYGIVAGLTCSKLGQDLVLFKDTVCVTTFNSLFYLFLIIAIVSFSLIFSVCCIVCTGVRHYKQDQKIYQQRNFLQVAQLTQAKLEKD